MNQVNIKGRLGADPEIRETKSGKKVCRISVGESRRRDDPTNWHSVEFWNEEADKIVRFFKKGQEILIKDGELIYDDWTDRNGNKHKSATIKFARWEFCGSRNESRPAPQQASRTGQVGPTTNPFEDDEVPF